MVDAFLATSPRILHVRERYYYQCEEVEELINLMIVKFSDYFILSYRSVKEDTPSPLLSIIKELNRSTEHNYY